MKSSKLLEDKEDIRIWRKYLQGKRDRLIKMQSPAGIKSDVGYDSVRGTSRQIERYRSVGFPDKELRKYRFSADDGGNEQATKVAKNYVKHFKDFKKAGKGLMLYGDVGTGKTFIAACIANDLIDECVPCIVTNFARITNKLSGTWEGKQEYIDVKVEGNDRRAT